MKMVLPVYSIQILTDCCMFSSMKTDWQGEEEKKSRIMKVFSRQIIKIAPRKVKVATLGDM